MSLDPDTLRAGDRVYSKSTYRMGNTTMRAEGIYPCKIESVEVVGEDGYVRSAMVKWNGNRAEYWPRHRLKRLFRFHPMPKRVPFTKDDAWARQLKRAEEIAAEEKEAWRKSGRNKRKVKP